MGKDTKKAYLRGSIFDREFMQSKVRTNRMNWKEKLFGYIIGPGMVYTFYTTVLGLRELYYMDVININGVFGSHFTYLIMTVVTTVLGMATGIYFGHITERTVCRAGRFRPYALMGAWIMAISGFAMFWIPFESGSPAQLIWIYASNFLYTCIGLTLWTTKDSVVSVCSRNLLERNTATTMRNAITNMMAGVVCSLGIIGVLYPAVLQKDMSGRSWIITIGALAVVAMIFSCVEYFWTRERITEDNQKVLSAESGNAMIQVPLKQQLKNLFCDKYFRLALVVTYGMLFVSNMQGGNARVNMITYILGGNDQNGLQIMYLMVAMQPMAIGAVVVPILASKFGARKIIRVSSVITALGVAIALVDPYNFGIAVAGGLVFSCGIFAVSNMYSVFAQQANDHIEYAYGYRPEGTLGAGILATLFTAALSPAQAIYETGLSVNGYVAGAMTQNQAVNDWILFAYYGTYVFAAALMFVICMFFDIEKKMPQIHAELKERAKQAAQKRGEVYVDPEEQERAEKEKAARELEEHRLAQLRAKCARKGLDFEIENQKYLAKRAKKERKRGKKGAAS